jgi:hypothetical protein
MTMDSVFQPNVMSPSKRYIPVDWRVDYEH